jgi:hypothetical protein
MFLIPSPSAADTEDWDLELAMLEGVSEREPIRYGWGELSSPMRFTTSNFYVVTMMTTDRASGYVCCFRVLAAEIPPPEGHGVWECCDRAFDRRGNNIVFVTLSDQTWSLDVRWDGRSTLFIIRLLSSPD